MSLIRTDGNSAIASIDELPALMKQWMKLQEEMAVLNAEVKQRRTQSKALRDMILRIMDANKLATLNVSKGAVVHKTREVKESISQDYLSKHCKEFFNGDETKAHALIQFLEERRACTVVHDLRILPGSGASDGGSSRGK
jgi:DNA-binding protein YbaB